LQPHQTAAEDLQPRTTAAEDLHPLNPRPTAAGVTLLIGKEGDAIRPARARTIEPARPAAIRVNPDRAAVAGVVRST
jgi:hypothetical protein